MAHIIAALRTVENMYTHLLTGLSSVSPAKYHDSKNKKIDLITAQWS